MGEARSHHYLNPPNMCPQGKQVSKWLYTNEMESRYKQSTDVFTGREK
jgi:hypothetical protein